MEHISKLKELLTTNPNDSFLQHALALEFIKTGNDTEAKSLFENILNHDPAYIGSYYHLAKLLERNEDNESATRWYKKGMEEAKKANDTHAYNELKSAYEELIY